MGQSIGVGGALLSLPHPHGPAGLGDGCGSPWLPVISDKLTPPKCFLPGTGKNV